MRPLLHDESGFTLVELLAASAIMLVLLAGLSNVFVSGLRASSTTNAVLSSQTSIHHSFDRLEFETRCASQATLVSGGAGVTLTAPSQCTHASGDITWCVTGGALVRYIGSSCSGTGETFASDVTSTAPFSCLGSAGSSNPQLEVALEVNSGPKPVSALSATDTITMRNASAGACS